jgi:hypothetical protein
VSGSIELHSLAWDNDNGCGCEIFASPEQRNEALREALLSYWKGPETGELTLDYLLDRLERSDFTDGARYVRGTHTIDLAAH